MRDTIDLLSSRSSASSRPFRGRDEEEDGPPLAPSRVLSRVLVLPVLGRPEPSMDLLDEDLRRGAGREEVGVVGGCRRNHRWPAQRIQHTPCE